MAHARIKFLMGGLAIALALTFLVVAGVRDGWVYSHDVDDVVEVASYQGKRLRLHGNVGSENFVENRVGLNARFELHGETKHLNVDYSGVIPDLFKPDNSVVVEGYIDEDGIFRADILLTKCASKYESEGGESVHGDPTFNQVVESSDTNPHADQSGKAEGDSK